MADLDQMNVQMDVSALVREEIITDRKIGTIRVLTPVTVDGTRDFARDVVYMGETQIMTQMGPLPISFQIKAATLADFVPNQGRHTRRSCQRLWRSSQGRCSRNYC